MKAAASSKAKPGGSGMHSAAAATQAWVPKPPVPPKAATASADLQVRHAVADRLDHAGVLGARHEGQRRLDLVLVLHDQQVGEVEARGLDLDQHLAGLGLGRRQLLPLQRLDADRVLAKPCMHVEPLRQCGRTSGAVAIDDTQPRRGAVASGRLPTIARCASSSPTTTATRPPASPRSSRPARGWASSRSWRPSRTPAAPRTR